MNTVRDAMHQNKTIFLSNFLPLDNMLSQIFSKKKEEKKKNEETKRKRRMKYIMQELINKISYLLKKNTSDATSFPF